MRYVDAQQSNPSRDSVVLWMDPGQSSAGSEGQNRCMAPRQVGPLLPRIYQSATWHGRKVLRFSLLGTEPKPFTLLNISTRAQWECPIALSTSTVAQRACNMRSICLHLYHKSLTRRSIERSSSYREWQSMQI